MFRKLPCAEVIRAFFRAVPKLAKTIDESKPMMAMTTKSSMSVNPREFFEEKLVRVKPPFLCFKNFTTINYKYLPTDLFRRE